MKITIFTSNQPRHLHLIQRLSEEFEEVYAIMECHSAFPGRREGFYQKSEIMKEYFSYVLKAEEKIFGQLSFTPKNVQTLSLKAGELDLVEPNILKEALQSDFYVVFGSSYIKGELCDWLVKHQAINIHMGISPYYRGNSCNFWAMYDGRPDLVGATIHLLSKGLDSGKILFHALPSATETDPFLLGMKAVESAQKGLVESLLSGEIVKLHSVSQNPKLELRYTKNQDFTDETAKYYLRNLPSKSFMGETLKNRDLSLFINPKVI
jgi:methionyl-tRNA formyltransferase